MGGEALARLGETQDSLLGMQVCTWIQQRNLCIISEYFFHNSMSTAFCSLLLFQATTLSTLPFNCIHFFSAAYTSFQLHVYLCTLGLERLFVHLPKYKSSALLSQMQQIHRALVRHKPVMLNSWIGQKALSTLPFICIHFLSAAYTQNVLSTIPFNCIHKLSYLLNQTWQQI